MAAPPHGSSWAQWGAAALKSQEETVKKEEDRKARKKDQNGLQKKTDRRKPIEENPSISTRPIQAGFRLPLTGK